MNWKTASATSDSKQSAMPPPSTTASRRDTAASARTGAGKSRGT
jgi:hypothetical protein